MSIRVLRFVFFSENLSQTLSRKVKHLFRLDGMLISQTMLGVRGGVSGPGKELIGSRNKVKHPYSTAEHEVDIMLRIRVHTSLASLVTCDRSSISWCVAYHGYTRSSKALYSIPVAKNEIFNTFNTADGREG